MYYLVPIEKNKTILYMVNGKKLLFDMTKKKLRLLINKFLKNKLTGEQHKLFSSFGLSLDGKNTIATSTKTSKKINFILNERAIANEALKYENIDDFISKNKNGAVKKNTNSLIAGFIFDDIFLDKIKKNIKLFQDMWCFLIGLEDFYLFKLGRGICPRCLQMRRLTNLRNIKENIIVEKYFNDNKIKLEIDKSCFLFLDKFKFNNNLQDYVFIFNNKQNKPLRAKLLPFPDCPGCVAKYPAKILKENYVNEYIGLLNPISTRVQKVGSFKFFISYAHVSRINVVSFLKLNKRGAKHREGIDYNIKNSLEFSLFRPIICGGVSFFDKKMSKAKALGESLERYCAAYLDKKKIIENNFKIFSKEKDCPWVLYNNEQYDLPEFPFKKLSRKSNIYYVRGNSLINGVSRFIPASFVYIRYPVSISDIGIYPTTGLACGTNIDRIRIDGICENIERDACMLTWLLRIPPKKIINITNDDILEIIKNFKIEGIDVYLLELSIDLKLPVILAVGVNKKNKALDHQTN